MSPKAGECGVLTVPRWANEFRRGAPHVIGQHCSMARDRRSSKRRLGPKEQKNVADRSRYYRTSEMPQDRPVTGRRIGNFWFLRPVILRGPFSVGSCVGRETAFMI